MVSHERNVDQEKEWKKGKKRTQLYFLKKQHLGWSTNKKPNDQPSDAFFDRKYLCSYLWSQYGFYIKDGSKDVKEYKKK